MMSWEVVSRLPVFFYHTVNESDIYLSLALQVGLAECLYHLHIQGFGGQMIGHMVSHVDHSDEGSLEFPNPEVFQQPAVTRLIHIHPHK